MSAIITEKDYPVQAIWLIKPIITPLMSLVVMSIMVGVVLGLFGFDLDSPMVGLLTFPLLFAGLMTISFFMTILQRNAFHYFIEDKFLTLRQGVFRRQERHIPYGVIQNLFVEQDLLDRLFGVASLIIENASREDASALEQSGTGILNMLMALHLVRVRGFIPKKKGIVGSSGNKVIIPGLTKANAETLKEIILQKMKQNPPQESNSGL